MPYHTATNLKMDATGRRCLAERTPRRMGALTKIDLLMDRLVVEPVGWHKLWSLDVPYADIVSVSEDHRLAENGPSGMRFPGASIPGVYLAGTFWKFWGGEHTWSFWLRRHAENCITLQLRNHRFSYITVEVSDPAGEIAAITNALQEHGYSLPASTPRAGR